MISASSFDQKNSSLEAPWSKYITENIKNGNITKLIVHCGNENNTKSYPVCTKKFINDSQVICQCSLCVDQNAESSSVVKNLNELNAKTNSKVTFKNNDEICKNMNNKQLLEPSKITSKLANNIVENQQNASIAENVNVSQFKFVPKYNYSKVISNNYVKVYKTDSFILKPPSTFVNLTDNVFKNIKVEEEQNQ